MSLAPACPSAGPSAGEAAALTGAALRRLTALCPALHAGISSGPGTPSRPGRPDGSELAADPATLQAWLDAEAARTPACRPGSPRRDVVASRALHGHLWSVCLLMSGPWYLERRVPLLRPQDVAVDLETNALTVAPGDFACLTGDPSAGLPGTMVVDDDEALRAVLRTTVADHVRPLLAAVRPHLRRGPRAMWGMVGDDLVSGVWYLGRMLDQEEHAVRAAGELLPGPLPPFPGGADFRRLLAPDGQAHLTRTRLGCCLYYALRPAEACGTCPRVPDTERLRRIAADAGA